MKINIIKIILAVLFFICVAKMPYGYYQLVRFIALIGFALLAYFANENGSKIETVIFIALAILFQPIIKIALGRSLWNIIDVIVGAYLVLSIFFKASNSKNGRTN
ncbi:MAG: hypothetical protein JSS64_07675 [Bacteroidetes bacterium]|nr:hypothetical protein [Bacteroidota bacterium]